MERWREERRGGGRDTEGGVGHLVVSPGYRQDVSSDGPADVPHHVTESVQHLTREAHRWAESGWATSVLPICYAQTSDSDNPRIVPHKPWIRPLCRQS